MGKNKPDLCIGAGIPTSKEAWLMHNADTHYTGEAGGPNEQPEPILHWQAFTGVYVAFIAVYAAFTLH